MEKLNKMGKLMLTCKDATALVELQNAGELIWPERYKLRLHLMLCKACRYYAKQSKRIDIFLKYHLSADHTSNRLIDFEKIKSRIKNSLDKFH